MGCCEHGDETSGTMSVEKFTTIWKTVSSRRRDTAVLSNPISDIVAVQLPVLAVLRVVYTHFRVKEREYFHFQKNYFVNRMY